LDSAQKDFTKLTRNSVATLFPVIAICSAISLFGCKGPSPVAAETVFQRARASVSKENLLIIFESQGCGACDRLNQYLSSSQVKEILAGRLVVTRIVVGGNGGNPGALELKEKLAVPNTGYPVYVAVNRSGGRIADSTFTYFGSRVNIGFPVGPVMGGQFIEFLSKACGGLSKGEKQTARACLSGIDWKIGG
jgi:hypothetical protein